MAIDERIEQWLREIAAMRGSDLVLAPGSPPMAKVLNELRPIDEPKLTAADTERLIRTLVKDRWDELLTQRQLDLSFSLGAVSRVRVNVFYQRGSLAAVFRLIPYEVPTLEQLGTPAVCVELCQRRQGFVLVTGPAGSGKSTTLAAMVDRISRTRKVNVITIEDPIEYVHRHNSSIVVQREMGGDALDFPTALRAALRESPDVVLVGEMRDLETISTAITIAETGHLVLATMHTNDTAQAMDRIVDVFPPEQQRQVAAQFAQSMIAVLHQRLLPRADGSGLVAAFEVMLGTGAIRNLIQERRANQLRNAIRTGARAGMRTLEMDLERMVNEGVVTVEAARGVAMHPDELNVAPPSDAPDKKGRWSRS
jgi:twitching motility protein PilT